MLFHSPHGKCVLDYNAQYFYFYTTLISEYVLKCATLTYPAGPEINEPLTERSSWHGSELSTLEIDVYIWCYALIVVHARNEWMNDPNLQGSRHSATSLSLYLTTNPVIYFVPLVISLASSQDKNRLRTLCFLLCCSTNLEPYAYCYQSLTITWLLQTSPQNSLLCLTITLTI